MKICPNCSIRYSHIWNICALCSNQLSKEITVPKVSSSQSLANSQPFGLIENIIDNVNAIFLYLDDRLRPVICNQAIEYITGYNREDIFANDWLQLLFADNSSRKEIFKAVLTSCLTSFKSRVYDVAITKKDGSECILSWRNAAVTDEGGHVIGIISTAQDITEHKSSEDNAAAQYERLRDIFASIKEYALITTNLEGKIIYYGKGAVELFRWEGDMTLKDISVLFSAAENENINNRIKNAISRTGKLEEEFMLQRQKGEPFPAILTVTTLLDSKNQRTGYIYMARDITERKKMEIEMVQTQKLAAIGRLASGVAHEINNPLLVIIGRIEMLSIEGIELDSNIKQMLGAIKSQAERIRIIVDRLLSYARKKTPAMEPIDVNEILKTVPALLSFHPEFNKITWKEEFADNLHKIIGNFNQLQEVFVNIGLNACQAMPQGGVVIITSKEIEGEFVEICFKDTGTGIKKENLNDIFNPFFSTKDKGTGLGLSVCQSLINLHGGKIEVESEFGKGSTFKIKLPITTGV